ncbi:MAG: hypothetical protein PUJ21_08205 [Clostridia bacterium]|nr:hypothetical protein [Clostridia bacterium]MDY6184925.1 hypothetical protein [Eubacteriales bacterium]
MLYTLLATDLHYCFSLAFTIGWEEWGVIATVGAVIVALWANIGAQKQLKSALKMQEQSKNVSLLEQRVDIADMIRADKEPSITAIRVLFGGEVCSIYDDLCQLRKLYREALDDKQAFFAAAQDYDNEGGHDCKVISTIEEYEEILGRPGFAPTFRPKFQSFCDTHEMSWSVTGYSNDRREYNYAKIYDRICALQSAINEVKDKILKAIETHVADSIAPVDKKQKRRGKL